MVSVFIEGFLLQASLIFALGAQNLFILESGLRRNHHITASFACYVCDFFVIMLGVVGAATLFTTFPEIKIIIGLIGIFFLFTYGLGRLQTKPDEVIISEALRSDKNIKKILVAAFSFSILNPHAYLDGVVLIGGYSAKYAGLEQRLALGLGASTYSLIWFLVLSTASSKMMPLFQNPRRMRMVTGCAGLFLIFLSAKLSLDVYSWVQEAYRLHHHDLPKAIAYHDVGIFQSILY